MNIAVALSGVKASVPTIAGSTSRLDCGAAAHVGAKSVVFYRVVKVHRKVWNSAPRGKRENPSTPGAARDRDLENLESLIERLAAAGYERSS